MAKIGMRYPIAMKITGYGTDGMPVYADGIYIGRGIKATMSYDTGDASLYADDDLAEFDNGVTGYSGSMDVDGFGTHQSAAKETEMSVQAYLFGGEAEKDGEGYTESYETTDGSSPYVGLVYLKKNVRNGMPYYVVKHCYKCYFSKPTDEANTKEKTVSFGTTSVDFTGCGIQLAGKENMSYTRDYQCATFDEALALIKKIGKIKDAETAGA